MNQYLLKVTGLKDGVYEIKIDGVSVGEKGASELNDGVNLVAEVLAKGPIADHVNAIFKAVVDKNQFYHDKIYRGMILSPGSSSRLARYPQRGS